MDVVTRVVRKNQNLESTLPLTISSLHGLVDQITYFNNRVASSNISNYFLVKRGEFAYNKSYSDGFPWGSVKRLDRYEMGVLSTLYIVFALNKDFVDSDYIVSFYETDNWHKEVAVRAAEGARNHGLLNISADNFFDTTVQYPKEKMEQVKIGTFFKQLDQLITLHQREYDKTVNIKKAMLEKMFPKEGEDRPEIRFAGFTDAWEQRKLGELAEFSKGQGYTKGDLRKAGTPIILYGRLYTKFETVISNVDTFTMEKENSVISKGKEVIVPASGETAEDISRASVVENAGIIIGGDLNIIQPANEIAPVFLAITISNGTQQKELSKRAQGKSVVHIHNSDLQKVMLIYPKINEQRKIGEFFTNLDHLITLHQRELKKLQNMKKALLEKMFV